MLEVQKNMTGGAFFSPSWNLMVFYKGSMSKRQQLACWQIFISATNKGCWKQFIKAAADCFLVSCRDQQSLSGFELEH